MEQNALSAMNGRHSGWSEEENRLLWETADEAQAKGLPLKQVFERIAEQTGRRPNSIRNYYYAQARQRQDGRVPSPRFVPFEESDVEQLVEQVLMARAAGRSVRACLQEISGGDHSLMLRYQNKYRSVLKNKPGMIEEIMERLKEEGVECPAPGIRTRIHGTVEQACGVLENAARSVSDAELIRACEVLARLMLSGRNEERSAVQMDRMNVRLDLYRMALSEKTRINEELCAAADRLTVGIKEYLVLSDEEKHANLPTFCAEMSERIGALEGRISEAATQRISDV